jgi:hypothetical protein
LKDVRYGALEVTWAFSAGWFLGKSCDLVNFEKRQRRTNNPKPSNRQYQSLTSTSGRPILSLGRLYTNNTPSWLTSQPPQPQPWPPPIPLLPLHPLRLPARQSNNLSSPRSLMRSSTRQNLQGLRRSMPLLRNDLCVLPRSSQSPAFPILKRLVIQSIILYMLLLAIANQSSLFRMPSRQSLISPDLITRTRQMPGASRSSNPN